MINPYVLPQRDAFRDLAKFEAASGIKGWNAQQGFYVFRNARLIVNGGWLNLKRMKADEHTKLARIIVDFDSSEDELWNVDVSKVRPVFLKEVWRPCRELQDRQENEPRKSQASRPVRQSLICAG